MAGAYVISGPRAAVSAIILAFDTNAVSPASHGNVYELYAIAAAVVGGCSLRGGEGSVLGIVLGTTPVLFPWYFAWTLIPVLTRWDMRHFAALTVVCTLAVLSMWLYAAELP